MLNAQNYRRTFVFVSILALLFIGGCIYMRQETRSDLQALPRLNVDMFKNCDAYNELRDVDFTDESLRHRICANTPLYSLNKGGRFPLCQLKKDLPKQFYQEISKTARIATVMSAMDSKKNVSVYTFSEQDMISRQMLQIHYWENELIREMLGLLKKFPTNSVTFLDVGSNLGLYSVQARQEGYPVVAVDANIRTLIRLQMTARKMGMLDDDLKLFWCFLDDEVAVKRMNWVALTHDCHIGGASSGSTNWGFSNPSMDTIPVMTARTDDLRQHIKTKKVIVKMDIESGEYMFMKTGAKLFQEFDVVLLQMEFWRTDAEKPPQTSPFFKFIADFMTARNYSLVTMAAEGRRVQNVNEFRSWDGMWIRNDYLKHMLS